MPDWKVDVKRYMPSHVGENTSHPPSPLILHKQVKKKQQQQKQQQWLAGPNTVLPMCFTSISSSVKRQKHVAVPLSPGPLLQKLLKSFLLGKSFSHTSLAPSKGACSPLAFSGAMMPTLTRGPWKLKCCQATCFIPFNMCTVLTAVQWWSDVK